MPQSLSCLLVHVVFSTKNRHPYIDDKIIDELHAYLVGICRDLNTFVLKVGGIEDHVHLLVNQPRTLTAAKLVEEIKKGSSKWMKSHGGPYAKFSWQNGYGAFSISNSHKPAVMQYISNQREHHHGESFQQEFRRLLKKYEVAYDERYVWD